MRRGGFRGHDRGHRGGRMPTPMERRMMEEGMLDPRTMEEIMMSPDGHDMVSNQTAQFVDPRTGAYGQFHTHRVLHRDGGMHYEWVGEEPQTHGKNPPNPPPGMDPRFQVDPRMGMRGPQGGGGRFEEEEEPDTPRRPPDQWFKERPGPRRRREPLSRELERMSRSFNTGNRAPQNRFAGLGGGQRGRGGPLGHGIHPDHEGLDPRNFEDLDLEEEDPNRKRWFVGPEWD